MKNIGIIKAFALLTACSCLYVASAHCEGLATTSSGKADSSAATHSTPENAATTHSVVSTAVVKRDLMKEAEQDRVRLLAEKGEADDLAKLKAKKDLSVECVFWRQQKLATKSVKAADKVKQFCGV